MLDTLRSEFLGSSSLAFTVILVRLVGALVLTGAIGLEREVDGRPAGLRTHMLIGIAACVYCLLMLDLLGQARDYGEHVRTDPIRIIEAVTSGVAFLAAGLIVFSKGRVRGLTTGASMWLAASVGTACGLGVWEIAVPTTVLALLVIRIVKGLEKRAGTYSKSLADDGAAEE